MEQITGQFLPDFCLNLSISDLKIESSVVEFDLIISFLEIKGNLIEEIQINNNEALEKYIDLCPRISKQIYLKCSKQCDDSILDRIRHQQMNDLRLHYLNLPNMNFQIFFRQQYPKLQTVEILQCNNFNNICLLLLLQNIPQLKTLSLVNLTQLSSQAIQQIGKFSPNIEEILLGNMNFSTYDTLKDIFSNCKKLQTISLIYLSQMKTEILQVINQNCQNLSKIYFLGLIFSDQEWIEEILKIVKLKDLSLINCFPLGNQDIVNIIKSGKKITSIDLSENQQLTDEALPAYDDQGVEYPFYRTLEDLFILNTTKITQK